MAVFNNFVCIRADKDVQKLKVTPTGKIKLIKLFQKICGNNYTRDIISDDIGDFWVCAINGYIKKIP